MTSQKSRNDIYFILKGKISLQEMLTHSYHAQKQEEIFCCYLLKNKPQEIRVYTARDKAEVNSADRAADEPILFLFLFLFSIVSWKSLR